MKIHRLILLISAFITLSSAAQSEQTGSIATSAESSDSIRIAPLIWHDSIQPRIGTTIPDNRPILLPNPLYSNRFVRPRKLHIPDQSFMPGQARFLNWKSGAIIAAGGVRSFPGMMQIESGSIKIYQNAGNFTFNVGGIVNKYGYFNGLHTQYGISGSVSHLIAPNISVTAFGEYYFGRPPYMANGMPMPPSMAGYYGRSKFGGYLDYQLNERWGVQTGIQAVQQLGSNRYEAEPIVTPYYKINKKVAIGLPVGQILYHLLKR